jgi:predicted O-methyltransferase YrrM
MVGMRNVAKETLRPLAIGLHKLGVRCGVSILPVHYYSEIPNVLELERDRPVWAKKSELPGISADLDQQERNLKEVCLPYQQEYAGNPFYKEAVTHGFGPGYGYVEGQALYAMVRTLKPQTITEVGSGVSTACMLAAARANQSETGQMPTITCIDPFPSPKVRSLPEVKLLAQKVQQVPVETFASLGPSDLLFIDSTHTVKPASDVNFLVLEVLPRLRSGVIVHFHDIHLPYDYQPDVLTTFYHWSETSLLRAFLINNSRAKIRFCLSQLHHERSDTLRQVFPEYSPERFVGGLVDNGQAPFSQSRNHFPTSTYIDIL